MATTTAVHRLSRPPSSSKACLPATARVSPRKKATKMRQKRRSPSSAANLTSSTASSAPKRSARPWKPMSFSYCPKSTKSKLPSPRRRATAPNVRSVRSRPKRATSVSPSRRNRRLAAKNRHNLHRTNPNPRLRHRSPVRNGRVASRQLLLPRPILNLPKRQPLPSARKHRSRR